MATGGDANTIGKYRLINCMASGNSCQVWEVVDSETTRRLAMKLLLSEKLADLEIVAALKHEFNVACTFDHPNIVKYHELHVKKQQAYFTMDLFPAPSLKTQLFNDIRGVHIRLKRLVELVAMALEHVHERGWLHRDMKPDNILMNKSAEVRLIDFSLASKAASALSKMLHRKQATVQGTRTYMAPEQILGKPLTVQTDIYNFGVTLFELLTGEPPFKGSTPKDLLLRHIGEPCPSPSEFNPNVTAEMSLIVQRMLSKKPEMRHKKMAEFMAEFRNTALFKEEVTEKVELTEKQMAEAELSSTLGERLDSRQDALRSQFGVAAPVKKKKKPPVVLPSATTVAKPPAAGQGGATPSAPFPAPQMPMQPMMPMAGMPQGPMGMPGMYPGGMPMPGMMPGQMPMAPYPNQPQYPAPQYPNMPMPQMPPGQMPWVNSMPPGQMPGMPVGPWQQPPPMMPQQPPQMPGAFPAPPPTSAPAVPVPPRPLPVPPPAAVPAGPAPPRAVQPPPPVKKPAPAKAAPPIKPGEGFNIGDMAGFDDLPPVS
jgi:serine/threonine-protein kinase